MTTNGKAEFEDS